MRLSIILMMLFYCIGCNKTNKKIAQHVNQENEIVCSDTGCTGTYIGQEFINGADIAHQFSNKMSTKGMGSGTVVYKLSIPFISVPEKCLAFTSFDHVGGWNHSPSLSKRKLELRDVLMKGHQLDVSELKTTKEGLQEYWIQWKNKKVQIDCE